jgi:hypothetical protein
MCYLGARLCLLLSAFFLHSLCVAVTATRRRSISWASPLRDQDLRRLRTSIHVLATVIPGEANRNLTSRYCFFESGILRVHHFKQGIPYSTSSFGNMSIRIFWEGEDDLFIGRTLNSLSGQRFIVQETVVSANNCGYWSKTAYCQ